MINATQGNFDWLIYSQQSLTTPQKWKSAKWSEIDWQTLERTHVPWMSIFVLIVICDESQRNWNSQRNDDSSNYHLVYWNVMQLLHKSMLVPRRMLQRMRLIFGGNSSCFWGETPRRVTFLGGNSSSSNLLHFYSQTLLPAHRGSFTVGSYNQLGVCVCGVGGVLRIFVTFWSPCGAVSVLKAEWEKEKEKGSPKSKLVNEVSLGCGLHFEHY